MTLLYLLAGAFAGSAIVYFWRAATLARLAADAAAARRQAVDATASTDIRLAEARSGFDALLANERMGFQTRLDDERSHAAQTLSEVKAQYERRIAELEIDKEHLKKEFTSIATQSLKDINAQYVESAIKDLRQVRTETGADVDKQKQEITNAVDQMRRRMDEYQSLVNKFETERGTIYGNLERQLTQLASSEEHLKQETAALKNALTTSSAVTGRWGELVLRNILTSSDLVAGIDFLEQDFTTSDDGGKFRPDVTINLPQGNTLVIDAKAQLMEKFVSAQNVDDPVRRQEMQDDFAKDVRRRVVDLASKNYQQHVDPAIPYVVMFVPSEAAIRAAFAADTDLFQYAASQRVIIASPVTLIPLVKLIAHAWQQQKLAENARELGNVVEELGNRLVTFIGHLGKMRNGMEQAQTGWNNAIGSWQLRLAPQIEKAKLLGGRLREVEEPRELPLELKQLPEA